MRCWQAQRRWAARPRREVRARLSLVRFFAMPGSRRPGAERRPSERKPQAPQFRPGQLRAGAPNGSEQVTCRHAAGLALRIYCIAIGQSLGMWVHRH